MRKEKGEEGPPGWRRSFRWDWSSHVPRPRSRGDLGVFHLALQGFPSSTKRPVFRSGVVRVFSVWVGFTWCHHYCSYSCRPGTRPVVDPEWSVSVAGNPCACQCHSSDTQCRSSRTGSVWWSHAVGIGTPVFDRNRTGPAPSFRPSPGVEIAGVLWVSQLLPSQPRRFLTGDRLPVSVPCTGSPDVPAGEYSAPNRRSTGCLQYALWRSMAS